MIILDVRTQEEYDSGHIKNSVCLPNENIISEPDILPDKSQEILVYCRSGNRSKQAAQKLADMGYESYLCFLATCKMAVHCYDFTLFSKSGVLHPTFKKR